MNATILKGVSIGNNVIIGANSLVNHDVPDNCVVGGNPAKVICSLEEYYRKRVAAQKQEAFEMYEKYVERYGKEPGPEVFDEFFWLFQKEDEPICPAFARQMNWHERYKETEQNLKERKPMFDGYDAFLIAARESVENNK